MCFALHGGRRISAIPVRRFLSERIVKYNFCFERVLSMKKQYLYCFLCIWETYSVPLSHSLCLMVNQHLNQQVHRSLQTEWKESTKEKFCCLHCWFEQDSKASQGSFQAVTVELAGLLKEPYSEHRILCVSQHSLTMAFLISLTEMWGVCRCIALVNHLLFFSCLEVVKALINYWKREIY